MAFGLMFADRLPAWSSRRRYETVEDRCGACTLYGGREEPCESEVRRREKWQKRYGQRCPRVDLEPENRVASRLAQMLMSEELRPLAQAYLEAAGPKSDDERARLMMIVSGAVNSQRVGDARQALIERASRKKTPGRNERIVSGDSIDSILTREEVRR